MVAKPNKNHIRTRETRALLLQSAETIFVRDGYEAAELGEIAALAGRSKGAIYAHFESKEDLFLALFRARNGRYIEQAKAAVGAAESEDDKLRNLRKFYIGVLEDEAWCLLTLEYKLFARRHPESRDRLMELYEESAAITQEANLTEVFGPAGEGSGYLTRSVATATLSAILSCIVLESGLAPALASKATSKKVLGHLFDAVMKSRPE